MKKIIYKKEIKKIKNDVDILFSMYEESHDFFKKKTIIQIDIIINNLSKIKNRLKEK